MNGIQLREYKNFNEQEKESYRITLRENMQKELMQIKDIDFAKNYLNKINAVITYIKKENVDPKLESIISEQKIRTERLLGELLLTRIQHQGGRIKTVDKADRLSLKDVGISKDQSSAFQKIASLPEETFEKEIETAKEESTEKNKLTQSRILKVAKLILREKKNNEFNKKIIIKNHTPKIYLGDSNEVLNEVEDKSIDLLLTDPPYGMDFKSGWNKKEKIKNDGLNETITLLDNVLEKTKNKLKDDAHFYLFGNIKYLEYIKPIISKHLNIKDILIWDRCVIGMGDLNSYGNSYDIIYFGYNKVWKNLNGIRERNVLKYERVVPNEMQHPTEKPRELLEYLIKKSTSENEIVLDPFAGGGSTLLASSNTNRKSIGIELEKKYYDLIKQRI
jgi:site-specific DNA-methyltransferase (adenine-specific)